MQLHQLNEHNAIRGKTKTRKQSYLINTSQHFPPPVCLEYKLAVSNTGIP